MARSEAPSRTVGRPAIPSSSPATAGYASSASSVSRRLKTATGARRTARKNVWRPCAPAHRGSSAPSPACPAARSHHLRSPARDRNARPYRTAQASSTSTPRARPRRQAKETPLRAAASLQRKGPPFEGSRRPSRAPEADAPPKASEPVRAHAAAASEPPKRQQSCSERNDASRSMRRRRRSSKHASAPSTSPRQSAARAHAATSLVRQIAHDASLRSVVRSPRPPHRARTPRASPNPKTR